MVKVSVRKHVFRFFSFEKYFSVRAFVQCITLCPINFKKVKLLREQLVYGCNKVTENKSIRNIITLNVTKQIK